MRQAGPLIDLQTIEGTPISESVLYMSTQYASQISAQSRDKMIDTLLSI